MKRAQGFTLMEVLVTLIITALAVALLFQALGSFNHARVRTAALEGVRDNKTVMAGWIGDTIRGIVAVDPRSLAVSKKGDPELGLTGDADGFSAMTVSPLESGTGIPTVIRWQVEHGPTDDGLAYRETGREALYLPMGQSLQFAYMDHQGKWHAQWPPEQGLQQALPDAIQLTYTDDGQPKVLVTAIAAPRPTLLAPYDLEVAE